MSKSYKLLIADDEFNTREMLGRYLRRRYEVDTAMDGVEAISKLAGTHYDLVLTDLRMPGADGFEVLEKANSSGKKTPCIVLTAYGSIVDAVKAVKAGAFDFVSKPIKLDQLETVIASALARAGETPQNDSTALVSTDVSGETVNSGTMVAPQSGSAMKQVYDTACDVAPSRATVLLTGESGTGKEVIAKLI
ncbi:MAG: sigma-54-dependent Fis family transcriptional regulator, partial [Lentisphaeria bacterium]|nr:sigma-54-dependent Fis family transcriptional regulator [Lentisphaeria bacterium]